MAFDPDLFSAVNDNQCTAIGGREAEIVACLVTFFSYFEKNYLSLFYPSINTQVDKNVDVLRKETKK